MKISVVIPVYNKAEYVEKCLESCLQQMFDDYEVIAVNDGSTDSSGVICEAIAKSDDRLRVITTVNGGVTAARRIGVEHAKGDFVTFVDADDKLLPHSLQTLYDAMVTSQADEVIGTFVDQYGNDHSTGRTGFVEHSVLLKEILAHQARFCILWGVLFKRIWLEDCLTAPRTIQSGEDKLMQMMYLMKHPKVYFIDQSVYGYTIDVPNNRKLNIEEERVYDDVLRNVLAPEMETYQYDYTLRQLKQYENFVDQRLFGQFERYYHQQISGKLSSKLPLADRLVYCLPPRISYYLIHWRKQFNA